MWRRTLNTEKWSRLRPRSDNPFKCCELNNVPQRVGMHMSRRSKPGLLKPLQQCAWVCASLQMQTCSCQRYTFPTLPCESGTFGIQYNFSLQFNIKFNFHHYLRTQRGENSKKANIIPTVQNSLEYIARYNAIPQNRYFPSCWLTR